MRELRHDAGLKLADAAINHHAVLECLLATHPKDLAQDELKRRRVGIQQAELAAGPAQQTLTRQTRQAFRGWVDVGDAYVSIESNDRIRRVFHQRAELRF